MYQLVEEWFKSTTSTEFSQIVFSFALGLISGPLSRGISFFFLFVCIYEIALWRITEGLPIYWQMRTRVVVNLASFLGWIVGRYLILEETGLEGFFGPEKKEIEEAGEEMN
jgi:hypothetical protein